MKLTHKLLICTVIAGLPFAGYAASPVPVTPADAVQGMASADSNLTIGTIKKVDAAQGKLTISHEALTNLNMPAMTMVFKVADPAMLTKVSAGDHVKFRAEKANGALMVMRIERQSDTALPN